MTSRAVTTRERSSLGLRGLSIDTPQRYRLRAETPYDNKDGVPDYDRLRHKRVEDLSGAMALMIPEGCCLELPLSDILYQFFPRKVQNLMDSFFHGGEVAHLLVEHRYNTGELGEQFKERMDCIVDGIHRVLSRSRGKWGDRLDVGYETYIVVDSKDGKVCGIQTEVTITQISSWLSQGGVHLTKLQYEVEIDGER